MSSTITTNTGAPGSPLIEIGVLGGTNITVTNTGTYTPGQGPVVYLQTDPVAGSIAVTSENGASVYLSEAANAAGAVHLYADGGFIDLGATGIAALGGTSATIENNGTFEVSGGTLLGLLNGGGLDFGVGGGTLDIADTPGSLLNLSATAAISGFASGDAIIDGGITYDDVARYVVSSSGGNQVVTFENSGGTSLGVLTFHGGTFPTTGTFATSAGPLHITDDGGALDLGVCFLAGTRIATPDGEVAVERLRVGDLVTTLAGAKRVAWLGHRHVAAAGPAAAGRAADQLYPVRIRAGAFGPAMPRRDLLVTPEHCIYVDEKLIPARMLVNGGSIVLDRSISSYTYYHVELDRHGILLAEGLTTESYLDTGNRSRFANAPVTALRETAAVPASAQDAAAPLTVDRPTVEPVWRALRERSMLLGFGVGKAAALTQDTDLHLETETGAKIRASRIAGRLHEFIIPPGCAAIRLKSRASRPCDTVGPYLDDRRYLGVLVGAIRLAHFSGARAVVPDGPGFHALEGEFCWTDGNALLPVDWAGLAGRPARLTVEVVEGGPYLAGPQTAPAAALAA